MLIGTYLLMCVIHKHTGNLVKLWKNLLSYGKDDITNPCDIVIQLALQPKGCTASAVAEVGFLPSIISTYLPPKLVKSFVEIEHPPAFPDVGSAALRDGRNATTRLLAVWSGPVAAAPASRCRPNCCQESVCESPISARLIPSSLQRVLCSLYQAMPRPFVPIFGILPDSTTRDREVGRT